MGSSSGYGTGGTSESQNRFKYQVFLSFRGPDVRKGFIDHLYRRLIAEGLTVFLDNINLPFGEEIAPNLDDAIEQSRVSVITLSPNYANSRWCLDEVVKIMKCKASSLDQSVVPVFHGVEPTDVRHQSGPYAEAFVKYGVRFKADMDRVFEYKTALRKLADLRGLSLNEVDGYEGKLVDDVVKEVKNRVRSNKLFVQKDVIGRDFIIQKISTWLEGISNDVEVGMIYGAGGMGKTTISKIVYNNNFANFTGSCFIVNFQSEASKDKGLTGILEQIVSNVSKTPSVKMHNTLSGLEQVKDVVGCRKTLLILDDVDDLTRVAAMFKERGFFYPGSKIIITTRNQEVRKVCKPVKEFNIMKLSEIESDKLFYLNSFESGQPPQEYVTLSKKIIKYCDGLPLALCILGSSLYDEPKESWEYTLKKLTTGPNDKVQSILRLSFDSIKDKSAQDLFLDIAHYFVGNIKECAFPVLEALTPYLSVLFSKLVNRCLVTIDGDGTLIMHQLIQEMALEVVRQEARNAPGHRSRLLQYESLEVLKEKKGTDKVRCFGADTHSQLDEQDGLVEINMDGFKGMENLEFLYLLGAELTGCYSNMPKKIKCLCLENCQNEPIPAKCKLDELIVLRMVYTDLERVWESGPDVVSFKALKVIDLSGMYRLEETPNFSGCPALEHICLCACTGMVKIHESITQLTKLTYLNVVFCMSLRRIPLIPSVSVDAHRCNRLVEIGDEITLELRTEMVSGRAKYMGYPELESFKDASRTSKVVYQSGICSSFIGGDHIAKWFTTIREGPRLTDIVSSLPARPIRAFNICCVYDAHSKMKETQLEVSILNQSNTSKWLFSPVLNLPDSKFKQHTWVTHWPITQQRELNAGDTLEVTFCIKYHTGYYETNNQKVKCGVEILYDEESEVEVSHWYDATFHISDRVKHGIEVAPGVYHIQNSHIDMVNDRLTTNY